MPLKTMPNTGTYFPPKCSVDGAPHYLVPVSMWHDHEDDAREAHVLQARVEELENGKAVAVMAQASLLTDLDTVSRDRTRCTVALERILVEAAKHATDESPEGWLWIDIVTTARKALGLPTTR